MPQVARATSHAQCLGFLLHIRLFPITFRKSKNLPCSGSAFTRKRAVSCSRCFAAGTPFHISGMELFRIASLRWPLRPLRCLRDLRSAPLHTSPWLRSSAVQKTERACSFRFATIAPSRLTYQKSKPNHPQKLKKATKAAPGLFLVKVLQPFGFARQKCPPPGKMSLCPIFPKKGAVVFFPAFFYFG